MTALNIPARFRSGGPQDLVVCGDVRGEHLTVGSHPRSSAINARAAHYEAFDLKLSVQCRGKSAPNPPAGDCPGQERWAQVDWQ